ncbi:MAG TPA: glycosyltransferase family 2 protein [Chloroflexota bacterium]|nr:glycosyltransferase family 2 protein [Chloroflexota bacterium]
MPSISIVTPSLNQGRFIERTIRSVLDQRDSALEYIVCDGGSTDDTLQIVERFAEQLTVVSEPDRGQADALNKGIRATSGEVIGWLNSDDMYLPGALCRVAEFLAARPEVDVLYGDAHLIDAEDAVVGVYYTEPWSAQRLVERCILCQPAVFFRRRVVEQYGFLDAGLQLCMDYEYWLRLAAGGARFAYVPGALAASRLHPQTKTLGARLAVHMEINSMLRERLGRVPDTWLLNHAHTLVELRRADPTKRAYWFPYALEVVMQTARLSVHWNRSISTGLVAMAVAPLVYGARRRLAESASMLSRSSPR